LTHSLNDIFLEKVQSVDVRLILKKSIENELIKHVQEQLAGHSGVMAEESAARRVVWAIARMHGFTVHDINKLFPSIRWRDVHKICKVMHEMLKQDSRLDAAPSHCLTLNRILESCIGKSESRASTGVTLAHPLEHNHTDALRTDWYWKQDGLPTSMVTQDQKLSSLGLLPLEDAALKIDRQPAVKQCDAMLTQEPSLQDLGLLSREDAAVEISLDTGSLPSLEQSDVMLHVLTQEPTSGIPIHQSRTDLDLVSDVEEVTKLNAMNYGPQSSFDESDVKLPVVTQTVASDPTNDSGLLSNVKEATANTAMHSPPDLGLVSGVVKPAVGSGSPWAMSDDEDLTDVAESPRVAAATAAVGSKKKKKRAKSGQ